MQEIAQAVEKLKQAMSENASSAEDMAGTALDIASYVQQLGRSEQMQGLSTAKEIMERAERTRAIIEAAQEKSSQMFNTAKADLEKAISDSVVVEEISLFETFAELFDLVVRFVACFQLLWG